MQLDELKRHLQQFFTDGIVVVVGSGLSCAEGLPGMWDLAEHLCDDVGGRLDKKERPQWNSLVSLIKKEGLEAALLKEPPSASIESAIVISSAELISRRERIVIDQVFNNTRTLRFTRLIRHLLRPKTGLPVITTNYDRLVEIAVEEAGFGVDTMFVGRFAGRVNERESRLSFCRDAKLYKGSVQFFYQQRALVYKPHGSLDWYLRAGVPVQYAGDLNSASRLIITPGKNKFRNGYESPFDQHRARANEAIDRATRFLILGYGFNDDHLETHLSPAIRNGKPALLITRSLSENAKTLATECANVIALDSEPSQNGTRVFSGKTESIYASIDLWDINNFVSEVLE